MAVTLVSRPDDFSSAYQPLEYTFTSDLSGANAALDSVFDKDGKAKIYYSGVSNYGAVVVGGTVVITNNGTYDGEYTIIEKNISFIVIDAAYDGQSLGGNLEFSLSNINVVCDLYVDGSFVVRKYRFANINNQFIFDFKGEVQPSLGNNMKPIVLDRTANVISEDSSASIYVKYAELYDDVSGGIATPTFILDETVTPNALFSDSANAVMVINSTVPNVEWLLGSMRGELISTDTDLSSFVTTASSTARFLTNSPKSIRIGEGDSYQLSAILDYDAAINYRKQIDAYGPGGVQTTRFTVLPTADNVWSFTAGTRGLSPASVPSTTTYYEVSIVDNANGNTPITETITFNIDRNCYATQTRFVWLNPRGGYDAYTFNSPRKLNSSVSKSSYSKTKSYPVVIDDRQESITNVIAKDSITTATDKVTKEVAEWLQELLESPQVFVELAEGNALHSERIPVTLINKTRAIGDSYNGLFNVKVRYKFAFDKPLLRAY